jgi:hypothetical protein
MHLNPLDALEAEKFLPGLLAGNKQVHCRKSDRALGVQLIAVSFWPEVSWSAVVPRPGSLTRIAMYSTPPIFPDNLQG